MVRAEPSKSILIAGLVVSMTAHLSVWAVASGFVRIGNERERAKEAAKKAHANPPAEQKRPRIKLGIDDSKATGLAWLGYAEATEHSAPQSSVDQSAMSPQPGANADAPAPEVAPPKLEQITASTSPPVRSKQMEEAAQAMSQAGRKLTDAIRSLSRPPTPPQSASTEAQRATTSPASAAKSPGTPGLPSDKESVASAVRKAPTVKPGEVLAANGLDIQTKAPKWSYTTMQTRRPGNPTVQITFGRDGKVIRAGFVTDGTRIYSTGYEDVDEPLLSAIYSWTARGKKLAEYTSQDPNGEVTILVTVILG